MKDANLNDGEAFPAIEVTEGRDVEIWGVVR
jgi:hypothetical protein